MVYPALKWIIILIGLLYLLNVVLWHYDSPMEVLGYLGGLSIVTFLFLLIATFALHLRFYHRVPLYYAMTLEVVNWADYYADLPWDEGGYMGFVAVLTALSVAMWMRSWLRWRQRRVMRDDVEEKADTARRSERDRRVYKAELLLLKVIPMVTAGMYVVDTALYCIDVSMAVPSLLIGTSLLPLLFIWLSSYVFQFCSYHRIFIYYVFIVNVLNYTSLYPALQMSDTKLTAVELIIAGLSLFLILYLYVKHRQKTAQATA